jgi:hypothetical protein
MTTFLLPAYALRSDVFKHGLARGSLGNPGRLVSSAVSGQTTVELQEHGFETNDAIIFRPTDAGVLPSPLVVGIPYYAIRQTSNEFQVSATPNGAPISFTTSAVSVLVGIDLPYDDVLQFYSRFVDGFLPAHLVPLPTDANGLYPITVVGIVASLTARKLQIIAGQISESMAQAEIAAKAQLERWAAGLPVREAVKPVPANLSVNASLGTNADAKLDPRGWGSSILP